VLIQAGYSGKVGFDARSPQGAKNGNFVKDSKSLNLAIPSTPQKSLYHFGISEFQAERIKFSPKMPFF
jgi:hypothetical protein